MKLAFWRGWLCGMFTMALAMGLLASVDAMLR